MIKAAAQHDLPFVEGIMESIRREDPSYWPYGLRADQFNGGLYLVKESASSTPVGFVGWQKFDEGGRPVGYYAIGILPEHRQKGFAKSAVAQVIREARKECDDVKAFIMAHNAPSKALARSLRIDMIEKLANAQLSLPKKLAMGLITSGVLDAAVNKDRGALGVMAQNPNADKWSLADFALNFGAGMTGHLPYIALAAGKTVATPAVRLMADRNKSYTDIAQTLKNKLPDSQGKSWAEAVPGAAWAGAAGLGAAGIAALLFNASRNRKLKEQELEQSAAGRVQVTLPTKNPGDVETRVDLPVGDLQLSNALRWRLGRDTRRRLNNETASRTQRRNQEPEEESEKAAALQGLVDEIAMWKRAAGPVPPSATPTPPVVGQNPALRMQQQQTATAQSITPPPAANPALMEAQQQAMQTEQAAAAQQSQMEQQAQQTQMEQQAQFQQAMMKSEQEKEVLKMQLEKAKVMAELNDAKAKSKDEVAQMQASASNGEGTQTQRLVGNRIKRLEKRVGSIKAAAASPLTVNGTDYRTGTKGLPGEINPATGQPVPPPMLHMRPEAVSRMNDNSGANALFPSLNVDRVSYGPMLDSAWDFFLKSKMMTPRPPARQFVSQTDLLNAPDKVGVLSQLYSNAVTTNPLLA